MRAKDKNIKLQTKKASEASENNSDSEEGKAKHGKPNFDESEHNTKIDRKLNTQGDHKEFLKQNIDILLKEQDENDIGGHKINGRIYTTD